MKALSPDVRQEAHALSAELTSLKARLGQLGFFRAMHAMDKTVFEFGFEFAERSALTDHGANVANELATVHRRYRKERER